MIILAFPTLGKNGEQEGYCLTEGRTENPPLSLIADDPSA